MSLGHVSGSSEHFTGGRSLLCDPSPNLVLPPPSVKRNIALNEGHLHNVNDLQDQEKQEELGVCPCAEKAGKEGEVYMQCNILDWILEE